MMIGIRIKQTRFSNFLKTFQSMDDLVLSINEEGIQAGGTVERAFFVSKWSNFTDGEESIGVGDIALGQLDTLISLIGECGIGNEEIELQLLEDGLLRVSGEQAVFTIPTVAEASSAAGVETIMGYLEESEADDWKPFGKGQFEYHVSFPAADFQQLRNVGKAIQSGALYCLEVDDKSLTLSVQRDRIRMDKTLNYDTDNEWAETSPPKEPVITWFGKWMMDALKAMPSKGVIHVHGGNDAPLLIRHEAPEEDKNGYGTHSVIAPRQEGVGGSV